MNIPGDEREFRGRMERIEGLLHEVDGWADVQARSQTREIVQAILDMHGTGMRQMLRTIVSSDAHGPALIEALAQDDLVGNLFVLHGLHPLDVEARVRLALDRVQPILHSLGGNVELLGIVEGVVRLRVQRSGHGCSSSSLALQSIIQEAIYGTAPDAARIEFEETTQPPTSQKETRIPLSLVQG